MACDRCRQLEIINDEHRKMNGELRERVKELDQFLSWLRAQVLEVQGIRKGEPLGKRPIADRGLRGV